MPAIPPPPYVTYRVLLLEDDPQVSQWVRLLLQQTRFSIECIAVENGFDAERLLTAEKFDLFVTDCLHHGTAADTLVRLAKQAKTPTIVLSAALADPDREQILKLAGADVLFCKPCEEDEVRAAICRLLSLPAISIFHGVVVTTANWQALWAMHRRVEGGSHPVLWLRGGVGVGKSALLKTLARTLEALHGNEAVFCAPANEVESLFVKALTRPEAGDVFDPIKRHRFVLLDHIGAKWPVRPLPRLLQTLLSHGCQVICAATVIPELESNAEQVLATSETVEVIDIGTPSPGDTVRILREAMSTDRLLTVDELYGIAAEAAGDIRRAIGYARAALIAKGVLPGVLAERDSRRARPAV